MDSYFDYVTARSTASITWRVSVASRGTAGTAMFVAQELQSQPHFPWSEPHHVPGHFGLPELMNGAPALATVVVVFGVNRFRYWQRGP
jgi:hypothetical protein